ncbi:MAG TPA: hypothetical protein VE985_04905 [Gaiellaceae bacterium]|nr:hypothetical protein [Gaiellaceae bacterium]
MKRAAVVAAALLAALAVAAQAGAAVPFGHKTAIGGKQPIRAYATLFPPVQLFGDAVTARVTVYADTKWVSPNGIRVATDFTPYRALKPPTVVRTQAGRFLEETWTWSLRCLTGPCVPVVPPSDRYHIFRFRPVSVDYRSPRGQAGYTVHARFPGLEALSQISPALAAYLLANKSIDWQYQLAPGTARPYRVSPSLVFWAATAIAVLLAAAGLAVAGRWALRFRAPAQDAPALPASYLERALAVFFWASAHGDETLQRKALERVADELPLDVIDLSEAARELAWSPEVPEGEEVEAISQRAGVPAHPENGKGE